MRRLLFGWCVVLLAGAATLAQAPAGITSDDFARDPAWEGYRNRLLPEKPAVTTQAFGYSRTAHAGGKAGEIGGRMQRSVTPAYYGKKIQTKTFDDKLSVSGKFAVTNAEGASTANIGWFNEKSRGWRTPNSLVMRFDGNGGKYWIFFEYCTQHWMAGGKGAFEGERYQTTPTKPFAADGTVHQFTLTYDPKGAGTMTLVIDGKETYTQELRPEDRADGATFDRFGLLNGMVGGNSMEVWFDDLTVDGETFDFSENPNWEGKGNRGKFAERMVRPLHDVGFSKTSFAGGSVGEVGGVMWRDEQPAYYAAKTGRLTLEDELYASGKLAFTGAGSDSGVYLGWFDSEAKKAQDRPQHEVPPTNHMAIMVEGPSRIGHYFRPAYWNAKGKGEIVGEGPIIRPDGKPHTFEFRYDPKGAGGRGRVTWKLDDVERSADLPEGVKEGGATFDRFGLFDCQSGGHYVILYLDDLKFTTSGAATKGAK